LHSLIPIPLLAQENAADQGWIAQMAAGAH
jgi:hypothetical protein